MSNEDATTSETTSTESQTETWKAPASQDELNAIVEKRLARERSKFANYDELATKAAKFDEVQNANKTEVEKLTERATQAESKVTAETLRADRAEIALEKGLTLTQAKRLVGTTRDELEADADELLKDLKGSGSKPPRGRGEKQTTGESKDDPMRELARSVFGRDD